MPEVKPPRDAELSSLVKRAIKIAVLLLALLLGGVTVAAWMMGDQSNLPFDYEGFD